MATAQSIAKRRSLAEQSISESVSALAEKFGVEIEDVYLPNRDPDLRHAVQLEAIANHLSAIGEKAIKPATTKAAALKEAEKVETEPRVKEAKAEATAKTATAAKPKAKGKK